MAVQESTDRRRLRGMKTRQAILAHAARVGSAEGLEAVSLQRLATDLGISKSGLFAHFGSKEELHMATIEAAARIFTDEVIRPALATPRGAGRVWALCNSWLSYLERGVFPGGCFFWAVAEEFDSRRPGPVRDSVLEKKNYWSYTLQRAVREAQASKNEPGSRSHAEYHGGRTLSPRSEIRPAPSSSPAVIKAGAVSPTAQRRSTAPVVAATRG